MPKKTFFNLPQEKKDRIIDTAILEFSQKHYKEVTIDNIVDGAAIPKGSFYQYFRNKDDLYQYIFSQIGDEKKQVLDEITRDIDQLDFKEYMIKLLQRSQQFETGDPRLAALKNKFMNECPQEIRKSVLKNEVPKSHALLANVITSYIKKGELKKNLNPRLCAYMITSCLVSLEDYQPIDPEKIRQVTNDMLDIIIDGIKNHRHEEESI